MDLNHKTLRLFTNCVLCYLGSEAIGGRKMGVVLFLFCCCHFVGVILLLLLFSLHSSVPFARASNMAASSIAIFSISTCTLPPPKKKKPAATQAMILDLVKISVHVPRVFEILFSIVKCVSFFKLCSCGKYCHVRF